MKRRWQELWYVPLSARRLGMLRILVGGFAFVDWLGRLRALLSGSQFRVEEFKPVGVVALLEQPLPPSGVWFFGLATGALALAFTLGFRYRLTAPLFAASLLWVTSYANSWGMIFHTQNLLVLHVLILAAAPAADALSWDAARGRTSVPSTAVDGRYGWAVRAMSVLTLASYVLAGVAKLKLSGSIWLDGGILRSQIAYDNLRKIELGGAYAPLGTWLVRKAAVFRPLAIATVLLELGAPLALIGRRAAWLWVSAAWLFHVGVLALMAIVFPYQLSLIAYASLFEVERLETFPPVRAVIAWVSRKSGRRG
jgi:hypothetical protein